MNKMSSLIKTATTKTPEILELKNIITELKNSIVSKVDLTIQKNKQYRDLDIGNYPVRGPKRKKNEESL